MQKMLGYDKCIAKLDNGIFVIDLSVYTFS